MKPISLNWYAWERKNKRVNWMLEKSALQHTLILVFYTFLRRSIGTKQTGKQHVLFLTWLSYIHNRSSKKEPVPILLDPTVFFVTVFLLGGSFYFSKRWIFILPKTWVNSLWPPWVNKLLILYANIHQSNEFMCLFNIISISRISIILTEFWP